MLFETTSRFKFDVPAVRSHFERYAVWEIAAFSAWRCLHVFCSSIDFSRSVNVEAVLRGSGCVLL